MLKKLDQARPTIGGQVFDVLGKLQFEGRSLRELLIRAIRYGEQPEMRARLTQVINSVFDQGELRDLLEEGALAHDAMDASRVHCIREDMERAEARRLQPHYIESFFLEAFKGLGGTVKKWGGAPHRDHARRGCHPRPSDWYRRTGSPRYERIAFEKSPIAPPGQPLATFVCPGHLLLDTVIDLALEGHRRHRDLLRRRTVLVAEKDIRTAPRVLFYLEHAIRDGSVTKSGNRRVVSKRLLFVEIDGAGTVRHLNYAPYIDYRPLGDGEPVTADLLARTECGWISPDLEGTAQGYAVAHVVPEHVAEVRDRKLELLGKTEAAVKDRLTKEINCWDSRAEKLKAQERAGKAVTQINFGEVRKRADGLQARLEKRLNEIKHERQISPMPPFVLGGVLIVPVGLAPQ